MALSKPMQTEFGIYHKSESCAQFYYLHPCFFTIVTTMMECILLYSFVIHLRICTSKIHSLRESLAIMLRPRERHCLSSSVTPSLCTAYALYIWCNLYRNALSSWVLNKTSLFCCYLQGRALRVVHGMCFGYLCHDGVDLQVQETEGEY